MISHQRQSKSFEMGFPLMEALIMGDWMSFQPLPIMHSFMAQDVHEELLGFELSMDHYAGFVKSVSFDRIDEASIETLKLHDLKVLNVGEGAVESDGIDDTKPLLAIGRRRIEYFQVFRLHKLYQFVMIAGVSRGMPH
jgi:hypothetical protein